MPQAKPSAVLELTGAYKTNPERRNKREPKAPCALPEDPPSHLSDEEVVAWNEIVTYAPVGALTGSDRFAVEMLARLLAEFRSGQRIDYKNVNALRTGLVTLGMTPASRAKITAPSDGEKGEFDID